MALASVEKLKSGALTSIFIGNSAPVWSPASGFAIDWVQRCGKALSLLILPSIYPQAPAQYVSDAA
jgi:hypothetical protein